MQQLRIDKVTGLVEVIHTSTNKVYSMWPVDAREALATGKYKLKQMPLATHLAIPGAIVPPQVPGDDTKKTDNDGTGHPAWLTADGKPNRIESDEKITVDQLRTILTESGQQFRSNASKADLINQWNGYVATLAK